MKKHKANDFDLFVGDVKIEPMKSKIYFDSNPKITLELLKEKFNNLFPIDDTYNERSRIANGKCEFCGKQDRLELHHICEKKDRRKAFERVFTTRLICDNCHKGSKKADMITRFRAELDTELLKHFTIQEVLCITGKTKIYGG